MNLSKIHHIAIIVSDYEVAKDFYVNKLGFAVIRENYRPEPTIPPPSAPPESSIPPHPLPEPRFCISRK